MVNLTNKEFKQLAMEGPLKIKEDINYIVVKVNSENIKMSKQLKEQLIKENKYDNSYVSFMTRETEKPYSMDYLPIYGRSDKYETKHLKDTADKSISADLRDRNMELLKRYNEFN